MKTAPLSIAVVAVLLLGLGYSRAIAAEMTVAAGAGYKKMVTEVAQVCEQDFGLKINGFFGNLGQIMAQIQNTGKVEAVIGDKKFFSAKDVEFVEQIPLGTGKLVLAWRKGISLQGIDDLKKPELKKIAMPDKEKAIYGRAANEFLESSGLKQVVADRLLMVATVPQVTSYLVTGEVDAGFVNVTDIMGIEDKIGGFLVLESGYDKIEIRSALIKEHAGSEAAALLQKCLSSDQVKAVAKKYGL